MTVKVREKVTEYKLDGTPTVKNLDMGEYKPVIKTVARWEAEVLIITSTVTVQDSVVETKSRLTLKGGRLVTETSITDRPTRQYEYTSTQK